MLVSIAWKNVWRNKLRSLIVIIAVTLGLIGGIFSAGLMIGANKEGVTNAINTYVSDMQIHNSEYLLDKDSKYYIENSKNIVDYLGNIEGVKFISSRIKVLGMASSASSAVGVNINGIEPEIEKTVTTIYENMLDSGSNYLESNVRNPIIISHKLADKLNLKLKSKIILTFPLNDGTYTVSAFKIVGIFKTANSGYDETNVYVKKVDLARLTGFSKDISHEIALRITDEANIEIIKNKINSKYENLSVQSWADIMPTLATASIMMNNMIFIFLLIILMALGFGIVNTMLMVVLERIKEIGMLMAVGMRKMRVFKMIMFETIFLSLVGGVIGMSISYGLLSYFGKRGISFTGVEQAFEKFGYSSVIYPELDNSFYFILSFLIILTGILASIYPARKALKLNPVEALRTDV